MKMAIELVLQLENQVEEVDQKQVVPQEVEEVNHHLMEEKIIMLEVEEVAVEVLVKEAKKLVAVEIVQVLIYLQQ